jgi:hypothetical protein
VDENVAEAEWGTTEAFECSVRSWAHTHGHPIVEIDSDDPQDLSTRAAHVALTWRRDNGINQPPLIIDQFIQSQPWHVLRTGAVPYWTVFPVQRCADAAETWIHENGPFARIDIALFNHGARSAGLAEIGRWQALTEAGQAPGTLLGQHPHAYPTDFAALTRATSALRDLPDGPPWPVLSVTRLTDLGTEQPPRGSGGLD